MTIKELSNDEILEMSAVEISYMMLKDKNNPAEFHTFFNDVADLKKIPKSQLDDRRTKLFTTLNIDGRFVHLGNNHWGLKEWYPVDKSDEDLSNTFQAPEEEVEEDREFEDIEDELDEIANEDDHDEDSDEEFDEYDDDDDQESDEEDEEDYDEEDNKS